MRFNELLYETIEVICEKTTADELIPFLEPLGFEVEKKTGTTVKVVVPAALRTTGVQQIANTLPGSTISDDGKKVHYDGATILVKPAEAQGGGLEKEEGQIIALDSSIKEHLKGQPFINLLVGKRMVAAAGVVKVQGTVKADAEIVDASGNAVAWISLKDGSSPTGFGQWGGINHLGRDPEIQAFVQSIKSSSGAVMPRGTTLGAPITNPNLKALACFGKDFGGAPGVSNVDIILQGHPTLTKGVKGSYVLTGTHTWANGDIPTGPYDPILTARYAGDRSDFGIKNARITIYPTGGRKWNPVPEPVTQPVATKAAPNPAPQPASIQNMKKPLAVSKIPMGSKPAPTV